MQKLYFAKLILKTCLFLVFASLLVTVLHSTWENSVEDKSKLNNAEGFKRLNDLREALTQAKKELSSSDISQTYWHYLNSLKTGIEINSEFNYSQFSENSHTATLWRPSNLKGDINDRILEQLVLSMDASRKPDFNNGKVFVYALYAWHTM